MRVDRDAAPVTLDVEQRELTGEGEVLGDRLGFRAGGLLAPLSARPSLRGVTERAGCAADAQGEDAAEPQLDRRVESVVMNVDPTAPAQALLNGHDWCM
ncbi:hypothetical protein ACFQ0G_14445 [Streptomyces chiangmaiensis]